MSVETVLLGIASMVLPPPHRARWREEASAVLMGVSGMRRLRYTLDTVVKVPILAWHRRSGTADSLPGRAISAAVGTALLMPGFAILSALTNMLPVGRLWDYFAGLLALGGLFALAATRSFHSARRHGGAPRYAGAALVTALVFAGPVTAWLLSTALYLPAVALVGAVPGVWLAAICVTALRRGTGPRLLAVIGVVAGLALTGVLGSAPLTQVPGEHPHVLPFSGLSLVVAAPAYFLWSGWAGIRLLLGRRDLLLT